jgi:hypothetical protein
VQAIDPLLWPSLARLRSILFKAGKAKVESDFNQSMRGSRGSAHLLLVSDNVAYVHVLPAHAFDVQ